MRGVNKVIIIGNLGADPETRQFNNGGSVTNISVATSEQWTDKESGEKRESTEWHRIALFNRLGEIAAQYLRKGSKVYIEGKLQTRKYDKNGVDTYSTEIKADQMQMLDGASDNNQQQSGQQNRPTQDQRQQNNPHAPSQQNHGGQQQDNSYQRGSTSQQPNQSSQQGNHPAMNGGGPVDGDIPFASHFAG